MEFKDVSKKKEEKILESIFNTTYKIKEKESLTWVFISWQKSLQIDSSYKNLLSDFFYFYFI